MSGLPPRPIRSFVRRQGRMTSGQSRALELHWAEYGLELTDGELDLSQVFGRVAPVILEIGFGDGKTLQALAQFLPEHDFIGIEVHRPGVGGLINNAAKAKVRNLRVFGDDAVEVLQHCIPDQSLTGVHLFFPDPWHKKRHHKRRILQPAFVQVVGQKLMPGGYFHMATDWQNYAEHMMTVMIAATGFHNSEPPGEYTPRPNYRPQTKFERRGLKLGHGVWDLVFIKS